MTRRVCPIAPVSCLLIAAQMTLLGSAESLATEEILPGPVHARLVRVIDGDTLVVEAQIWLGQRIDTTVRLAGIDAPETRGYCSAEKDQAAAATRALIDLAAIEPLTLHDIRLGTFAGRVVARVENAAGDDMSSALLSAGHAVLYNGKGPRPDWCAAHAELPSSD